MADSTLSPAVKRVMDYITENPDEVFEDGVVSMGDFFTITDNDNDIWARGTKAEGGDQTGGPVPNREDIRPALLELRKMGASDYYQKISSYWLAPDRGWNIWQKWTDKIPGFANFPAIKKQVLYMLMELYYEQKRYFEDNTDIIQLTSKTEQNNSHPSYTIREMAPILLNEHSPQILSPEQNPLWKKLFGASASEAYQMVIGAHNTLGFGAQFYQELATLPPGQQETPARQNAGNHMAYLLGMIEQIVASGK